jgi:hypothetical protein
MLRGEEGTDWQTGSGNEGEEAHGEILILPADFGKTNGGKNAVKHTINERGKWREKEREEEREREGGGREKFYLFAPTLLKQTVVEKECSQAHYQREGELEGEERRKERKERRKAGGGGRREKRNFNSPRRY